MGLTVGQSKVLTALQYGESMSMRELADRIRSDPSNLTRLVDKLEDRRLLLRVPDPTDRRIKALVLTDQGVQVRSAFWMRLSGDAGPMGHLNRAELVALRDALRAAVVDKRYGSQSTATHDWIPAESVPTAS